MGNPMSLNLPGAVATYMAAEQAKDADRLALCFAEDARARRACDHLRLLTGSG
jgi:hypothetical protein